MVSAYGYVDIILTTPQFLLLAFLIRLLLLDGVTREFRCVYRQFLDPSMLLDVMRRKHWIASIRARKHNPYWVAVFKLAYTIRLAYVGAQV